MKLLLLASLLAVAVAADLEWESWKQEHSKQYEDDATEQQRYSIWKENKAFIEQHNNNADQHGYTMGTNNYTDLTSEEFVAAMNGYVMRPITNSTAVDVFKSTGKSIPDQVDWREKGAVTKVKNQGQCGSCWAFSTTGSLEGQHFLKEGELVSLSEQNLMDCSKHEGNHGCEGGLMDDGFEYIIKNKGVDTEESYPYKGHDEKCRFKASNVGATMTKYHDVLHHDVKALTEAIAEVGPISVAMDASWASFQHYKKGVYSEKRCSSRKLDHGVLAVGYGTYEGTNYFLVKNSWGKSWGDEGYFMIKRGLDNMCGLATQASYPKV